MPGYGLGIRPLQIGKSIVSGEAAYKMMKQEEKVLSYITEQEVQEFCRR